MRGSLGDIDRYTESVYRGKKMIGRLRSACTRIIHKAYFCVVERRLPLRFIQGKRQVKRSWYKTLELSRKTTRKITVGFGPIISGEHDLHIRKWRIDPIVNCINEISDKYCAGVFFNAEEMQRFDLVVIVREVDGMPAAALHGRIVIYDIVDRPYYAGDIQTIRKTFEMIQEADGLIASSPLHIEDLSGSGKKMVLIEHPIINIRHKDYTKRNDDTLTILWQGFPEHLPRMDILQPIVRLLAKELKKKIILMYHTRMLPKSRGSVRYRPWTAHNWERVLVKSDIGVEIKSLDDAHLQRKPSTKILTYMAAGLPVVCTPSAADRLVIEHGKTGYFACTDEEWYTYLKALAENPGFRQQMGQAGREYVSRHFNIPKIAQKYLDFFDALIKEANEHTKRKKQTVSKRNQ
jgi:hypothetical protein